MAETVHSFLKQPFYRLNFNLDLNCFTNITLIKHEKIKNKRKNKINPQ